MIYTSSPLVVRADTSVSECLRLMKEQNIGSILISSEDRDHTLIGIFTERDLLRKIGLIQAGLHWDYPVKLVMTTPVKTITSAELPQAGKIMLQGNFRHLPIIEKDKTGRECILGVVSMRDLYRALIMKENLRAPMGSETLDEAPQKNTQKMRLHVVSINLAFSKFIENTFNTTLGLKVRRSKIDSDLGDRPLTMIFDIDGFEKDVWPKKLVEMNHSPLVELIVVVFNPDLHAPEHLGVLEKLGKSKKFWIFRKPLEIFDLLNRVTELLSKA